jgi:hypothetical protein
VELAGEEVGGGVADTGACRGVHGCVKSSNTEEERLRHVHIRQHAFYCTSSQYRIVLVLGRYVEVGVI